MNSLTEFHLGSANAATPGSNFYESWSQYIKTCTLIGIELDIINKDDLFRTADFLSALRFDSLNHAAKIRIGGMPQTLICDVAFEALEGYPAEPTPLVDGSDIATAAHDDAQNCLFVGTQCTPDSFGACISRDRVLCCFNAPLSRLAQEAAAGQFGRDFGTVETPNCRGMNGREINALDWRAVDLEQWTTILGTADRLPEPDDLTPDGLTGTGNVLNIVDPDAPRPDVIERTRLRLQGIDPAQVRSRGRDEIRGGGQ